MKSVSRVQLSSSNRATQRVSTSWAQQRSVSRSIQPRVSAKPHAHVTQPVSRAKLFTNTRDSLHGSGSRSVVPYFRTFHSSVHLNDNIFNKLKGFFNKKEHEESGEPKSRLPEDEDRQRNAARMQELNDLSNFAQKTYEDMMGKKENTKEDTEDKKPSFMEMMNQLRHLGPLLKDAQFTRELMEVGRETGAVNGTNMKKVVKIMRYFTQEELRNPAAVSQVSKERVAYQSGESLEDVQMALDFHRRTKPIQEKLGAMINSGEVSKETLQNLMKFINK